MLEIGRQIRHIDGYKVECEEIQSAGSAKRCIELLLDRGSKEVKRQHVPQQVHVVFMDEAGGNKPVVLRLPMRIIRIHHEARQDGGRLESVQAYQRCDADDDISKVQTKTIMLPSQT